jgi:hypothetical protein
MNLPEVVLAKYDLKEVGYADYSYFHVWSFEPKFLWTCVKQDGIFCAKEIEYRFFYLLKGDAPSSGSFCQNTWDPSNPNFAEPFPQFNIFLIKEEAEQEVDELNFGLRKTLCQKIDARRVAIKELEDESRDYQAILEKLNQKDW